MLAMKNKEKKMTTMMNYSTSSAVDSTPYINEDDDDDDDNAVRLPRLLVVSAFLPRLPVVSDKAIEEKDKCRYHH